MSHAPDCDLEVYGKLPNAQGVICTCDQDDGPEHDDEPAALPSAPAGGVTLTGEAARTYRVFCSAAGDLKRAQAKHEAALRAFTEAIAK